MRLFIGLPILAILLGCAATSMTSRVNPEYANHNYGSILVIGALPSMELQEAIEIKVKSALDKDSVVCYMGHEVFFPGRSYTADEYISRIDKLGVEGLLIITPTGAGYSESYVPPKTTTKTTGSARARYGSVSYREKTTTTTSGGYSVNKPWASFEASLYDLQTGECVWFATAKTGGNALANFKTVVRSMGGKTVNNLERDGLLR